MLDRDRRDLDVRDVVAPEPGRPGELGGDRRVTRPGRDDAGGGLLEERRRDGPPLTDGEGVAAEHPGARDETDERVEDRPAESHHSLAVLQSLLEPRAGSCSGASVNVA